MAGGKKKNNAATGEVVGTTRLGAYEVRQDKDGNLFYWNVLGQKVPVYQGQYDPYFAIQNSNQVDISKGNYQAVRDSDFSPELFDILGVAIYPKVGTDSISGNLYNSFDYLSGMRGKYKAYQAFYASAERQEKEHYLVERLDQISREIYTIVNRFKKDAIGATADAAVVGLISLITKDPLTTSIVSKVKKFAGERTINTRTNYLIRDYGELLEEKKAIEDYLNRKNEKIIIGVVIALAFGSALIYFKVKGKI